MTLQNVTPQVLQRPAGPSQPSSPTIASPVSFSGGDRIVVKPPAGDSLRAERLFLRVTNTDASSHTITIPAGDPVLGVAWQRVTTYTVPAGAARYVGPFDSSLSTQRDGTLILDFEAGHSGTFEAYLMPKGF